MANPYQRIWEHNGRDPDKDAYTLPTDMVLPSHDDCPGRRIIARTAAHAGQNAMTFAHLFAAFTEARFTQHWTWQPASGGWNTYGLLDDTKTRGECLHFAKNLWFLARAPAPWGLGLSRDQIRTSTYKGAAGEGFVSAHNGIFLNLRANVAAAQGYVGAPLYCWADHKTVLYNGQYWDPCYVTQYAAEANMALYQLTGRYVRTDSDGVWDLNNRTTLGLQTEGKTAEKATRNGRYFYFRRVVPRENRGAHISFEGPIDETRLELMRSASRGIRLVR
ncbi:hypothetical protein WMF31_13280 [Sorangium sp. So ce1036]|uniref:hypothetical protein n=1 Tax=Sorangium sp. So ce1036 TaxID=3133328 RepID=UPI003F09426B